MKQRISELNLPGLRRFMLALFAGFFAAVLLRVWFGTPQFFPSEAWVAATKPISWLIEILVVAVAIYLGLPRHRMAESASVSENDQYTSFFALFVIASPLTVLVVFIGIQSAMNGAVGSFFSGLNAEPRSFSATLESKNDGRGGRGYSVPNWTFDGSIWGRRFYGVPASVVDCAQKGAKVTFTGEGKWIGVRVDRIDVAQRTPGWKIEIVMRENGKAGRPKVDVVGRCG